MTEVLDRAKGGGHRVHCAAAATPVKASTDAAKKVDKTGPESTIEGYADERIESRMSHGQRVGGEPDELNVGVLVDGWVAIANEKENVEGQPAEGEGDHTENQHFDHLKEKDDEFLENGSIFARVCLSF